ncbi:hypothetical protein BD324DRAFT_637420 [Kockovaella imperatae]|uniref:Uncharacterized protein n=1 Tax=Kockovaella imperatae TaxID=4999 RepID=A0A1Y1U8D0_9TREE|nr:hypothetical protein BD324DRAFT_637420 [Kockovaella imperatae]ORX34291.1 hypothetical protein BD324DRAFT_637420 [Kockovaella imperatae]
MSESAGTTDAIEDFSKNTYKSLEDLVAKRGGQSTDKFGTHCEDVRIGPDTTDPQDTAFVVQNSDIAGITEVISLTDTHSNRGLMIFGIHNYLPDKAKWYSVQHDFYTAVPDDGSVTLTGDYTAFEPSTFKINPPDFPARHLHQAYLMHDQNQRSASPIWILLSDGPSETVGGLRNVMLAKHLVDTVRSLSQSNDRQSSWPSNWPIAGEEYCAQHSNTEDGLTTQGSKAQEESVPHHAGGDEA